MALAEFGIFLSAALLLRFIFWDKEKMLKERIKIEKKIKKTKMKTFLLFGDLTLFFIKFQAFFKKGEKGFLDDKNNFFIIF